MHANAVAAAASLACPTVRFLQSIQTTQPRPRWHWAVQSLAQLSAETVVVPSPSVADVARRWAGVAREKIVVIPNAVEAEKFARGTRLQPVRGATHGLQTRATGNPSVGFIGRLDPIKRLPDLVYAIRSVRAAHLNIFGEGSDRQRTERLVRELGLGDRVTLHDWF